MRDSSQPTCISISLNDDFILIKDLNGGLHICGQSDAKKIGEKIIQIIKNSELPEFDVMKVIAKDNNGSQQADPLIQGLTGLASMFLNNNR